MLVLRVEQKGKTAEERFIKRVSLGRGFCRRADVGCHIYPVGGGAYVGRVGLLNLQHVTRFLYYRDGVTGLSGGRYNVQTHPQTNDQWQCYGCGHTK